MKRLLSKVGFGIFYLYLFSVFAVFTPYFNWRYAQDHGFWNWVAFGEVIATSKAVVWPYYVLTPDYSKATARSFLAALNHSKKGNEIINRGGPYSTVPDTDMFAVVGYYRDALKEGRQADIQELNKFYAGLGDHFQNEFLTGLELYISGWDKKDWNALLRGQATMNLWGSWYNNNINAIKKSGP